jgi:hypothetical protein
MLKKCLLTLLAFVGFQAINAQNPPPYVDENLPVYVRENPPAYQKYDLQNLVTIGRTPGSYSPIDLTVDNNGDAYLRTLPEELQAVIIAKAKTIKSPYIIRIAAADRTLEAMRNFDNFKAKTLYSPLLEGKRPLRFITDFRNIKDTAETDKRDKNLVGREWYNGMRHDLN